MSGRAPLPKKLLRKKKSQIILPSHFSRSHLTLLHYPPDCALLATVVPVSRSELPNYSWCALASNLFPPSPPTPSDPPLRPATCVLRRPSSASPLLAICPAAYLTYDTHHKDHYCRDGSRAELSKILPRPCATPASAQARRQKRRSQSVASPPALPGRPRACNHPTPRCRYLFALFALPSTSPQPSPCETFQSIGDATDVARHSAKSKAALHHRPPVARQSASSSQLALTRQHFSYVALRRPKL